MTLEQFLEAARAIAPREPIRVQISAGENYGYKFSIHVLRNGNIVGTFGSDESPEAACEELREWVKTSAERREQRKAELKTELAELETKI